METYEEIRLKIDDEASVEIEFDKLHSLMKLMNIDCKMEVIEKESMSGTKFYDKYMVIRYDRQEVYRKLHRSRGGDKKKMNRSYIKVEEVRKRMETENADEIAESLGISRATLFRRLKQAEEKNEKYIF